MTDTVNKLTLVIQEVKTADKKSVDVIFGTVLLNPEDKKSKMGETINFHTLLGQVPAFEKHINRIIKEALDLKKKQDETNNNTTKTESKTSKVGTKGKGSKGGNK